MPLPPSQLSPLRRIIANAAPNPASAGGSETVAGSLAPAVLPHFHGKPHRLRKGETLATTAGVSDETEGAPPVQAADGAPPHPPETTEPQSVASPAGAHPLRRPEGPCTPERLTELEQQIARKEATLVEVEQTLESLRTELARAERRTAAVRRLSGFRERVIRSFEPQGPPETNVGADYASALKGDVAELERTLVEKQETIRQLEQGTVRLRKEVAWLEQSRLMLRQAADLHWGTVHIFARGLIKQIDRIEDTLASGTGDAAWLESMRDSLLALLLDQSVEPFTVEPGTVLDMTTRRKVHIIDGSESLNGPGEVISVVRPGYVCQNGAGVPTVLRKVEVRAATRGSLVTA